ncbi:hypothetical protein [Paludibaculum fermentans]|uniref:Uncharacterized protein n=1 Tax=Paludibaculum fermentans TaxID=1473598 RepID=A0A7S7NK86_PALFE|nr:hypothetical protein [Paludibaculum fermentans]QOY85183.1 hypothetical protein IRI77_20315 [Paludibaculum fermentans]
MKLVLVFLTAGLGLLSAGDYSGYYGGKYKGLWLEVSSEAAPPGGVAQVRITLTEPKPIIRTKLYLEFDEQVVEQIMSVGAYSENVEATGVATRRGNVLVVEAASPTGNLGKLPWYPIFSISVKLRDGLPAGTSSLFTIGANSEFYQPDGTPWTIESNKAGSVAVDGSLSIDDVFPGGGTIQPGEFVKVTGRGFTPQSQVAAYSAPGVANYAADALQVEYVSSTELHVTSGTPFSLDLRYLEVTNPDQSEKRFYTSLSGIDTSPSLFDNLSAAKPLFAPRTFDTAILPVSQLSPESGAFQGIALQNPSQDAIAVRLEVASPDGVGFASANATLLPREQLLKDMEEVFPGLALPAGTTLRIQSSAPVRLMGIAGDRNAGTIQPVIPSVPSSN